MYKNSSRIVLVISILSFTGCDQVSEIMGNNKVDCSNPDATLLLTEVLQKSVNSGAKDYTGQFDTRINGASIRASVDQLKMDLSQVRTTKEDPQSTKNFCMGTLKVTIPTDMIEHADYTRNYFDEWSVEDEAYEQDFDLDANSVSYEVDYSVQPSDDGKVIFVETQNGVDLTEFLATIVVDANQRSNVQKLKVVENKAIEQAKVEREQAEIEIEQAVQSAESEASHEMADIAIEKSKVKAEMDFKRSEFNEMWGEAPKEAQEALVNSQKSWVEQRDKICVDEAMYAEPARQEIVRMQCVTRLLGERYYDVKSFFDNY